MSFGNGLRAAALGALTIGALACNVIFGVHGGKRAAGTGGEGGSGGSGGACQPSKPATCDPSLLADEENCCVMGRSCQGGACSEGECKEVQLATSAAGEEGLSVVIAGDEVVWSSGYGRSIYSTGLDGGGRAVLVGPNDTPLDEITMLALDADAGQIYFTNKLGAGIGRVGLASGKVEHFAQIPVAGAKAGYGRILVYEGYVYVAADYQITPAGASGVFRAPVGAAGPFPVDMEKVADIEGAFGLAAANGYLYYGDAATQAIYRVGVASIGASTPEIVVDNQPSIGELAVDAERIYWPVGEDVWGHALTPGGPKVLVHTDDSYVFGIVADADYIWWSTAGDSASVPGLLRRIDRALKGSPQVLYTTPPGQSLATVTADCDTVYLLVREGGKVLKTSK